MTDGIHGSPSAQGQKIERIAPPSKNHCDTACNDEDGRESAMAKMTEDQVDLNTGIPHSARVYDHILGDKDNYPADREAAADIVADWPHLPKSMRANRNSWRGRPVVSPPSSASASSSTSARACPPRPPCTGGPVRRAGVADRLRRQDHLPGRRPPRPRPRGVRSPGRPRPRVRRHRPQTLSRVRWARG